VIVRPTFLAALVALACGACASGGGIPRPFPGAALPPRASEPAPAAAPSTPDVAVAAGEPVLTQVIATALALRGTPYRNGGSSPSAGFDCSGFVQWVFAQHATRLPRQTLDQYHAGDVVSRASIQPGDLVFFETVARGASHVGLAIGGDQFVHAPSSQGVVRVERFTASYWRMRFVGARRVATPAHSD
jgi:cell wall-associated NlpC family hydrolase